MLAFKAAVYAKNFCWVGLVGSVWDRGLGCGAVGCRLVLGVFRGLLDQGWEESATVDNWGSFLQGVLGGCR